MQTPVAPKMNHHSLTALLATSLLATSLLASLLGCAGGSSNPLAAIQAAQAKNAGNFTTTVFLGDSLTAGYQSGSLLDTQQVHGWAPLVATQASFNISLPLIAPPGAPNVLQLVTVNPLVITTATGTTTGRDNFATQATDLAVPGAFLNDVANTVPLVNPAAGQQQLNQLVLGFPGLGYGQDYSQATFAIKANPTTIFLWIGNNDALIADITGTTSSMTSTASFTTQYQALITQLTTMTSAHLVIANIPDVTLVPYLQPAATVLAQASASTGVPVATLSALLGITTGDFVNPTGTAQISLILGGAQRGPLTDAGVLSAAEVVAVKAQVATYNQVISQQATAAGATLVDINALFNQVAASGLTVSGSTGTASFLGGFFSLDGIHPTNTGYAVVANKFIDSMNAGIGTKIADVNLVPVAAADPLWPVNLAHHADLPAIQAQVIPINALRSIDNLMLPAQQK
jgi:lysophospholipase L1-like esterase